jgi:hypothetical protein
LFRAPIADGQQMRSAAVGADERAPGVGGVAALVAFAIADTLLLWIETAR